MKKKEKVEQIQKRAILTFGETTCRVSCDIAVYQEWVYTNTSGDGEQYSPGLFDITGTIKLEDPTAPPIVEGVTHILNLGDGRKLGIGILSEVLLIRDEMNFFDTPRYRKSDEEQR